MMRRFIRQVNWQRRPRPRRCPSYVQLEGRNMFYRYLSLSSCARALGKLSPSLPDSARVGRQVNCGLQAASGRWRFQAGNGNGGGGGSSSSQASCGPNYDCIVVVCLTCCWLTATPIGSAGLAGQLRRRSHRLRSALLFSTSSAYLRSEYL